MSNFVKEYFEKLRISDEKTKHRSALTISIVASIVILFFTFLFVKDSLFNFSPKKDITENEAITENKKEIESPFVSFKNFIKDTGSQMSSLKSSFSEIVSISKNKEKLEKENNFLESSSTNISSSTNTNNINNGSSSSLLE